MREAVGRVRRSGQGSSPHSSPTIAILGAGVAGLCMGIRLLKAGISSFIIFEKSDRVGGTWYDNSYPGAGCDVPSHLYCYSFEPNPNWSRKFSLQLEIQDYLDHCAVKYGLMKHIRFRTEIAGASFDEGQGVWRMRTTTGEELCAHVLVSATGQLNRPHVPKLLGLDCFEGTTFHSARWNHDHDLAGENVAVVGNGASAIQFVPCIARVARKVTIFQRSANYVVPRFDRAYKPWERWIFQNVPLALWLYRATIYWRLEARFFGFFRDSWVGKKLREGALKYLGQWVSDPALAERLTPDYPIGCKRILISDDYYESLVRPNVEVVTEPIAGVARRGIVTEDGISRSFDTIIFATGFETTSFLAPMQIEGLGGRKLAEEWRTGAEAYLGVTLSGYPNLFLLYGPNTNLGHNSIIFMIECQVNYVLQCIQQLMRQGLSYLDVRREAMDQYNQHVQRAIEKTAWAAGCHSWYKTESGKVTNNWSGFTVEYWWKTRQPDFGAYELVPRG
ncbi:MAG TPA: NAD(P)/FAD-dependent oxidoreductase [Myxococcota bacterium]|nr:NAD(P)/FAD-dependent oxidoreductase [Myxococcota bacterium]